MPKKPAKKPKVGPVTLSEKFIGAVAALQAGKAGYAEYDRLMDDIENSVGQKRVFVLADGRKVKLVDKWKGQSRFWAGRQVRRYEVEIVET